MEGGRPPPGWRGRECVSLELDPAQGGVAVDAQHIVALGQMADVEGLAVLAVALDVHHLGARHAQHDNRADSLGRVNGEVGAGGDGVHACDAVVVSGDVGDVGGTAPYSRCYLGRRLADVGVGGGVMGHGAELGLTGIGSHDCVCHNGVAAGAGSRTLVGHVTRVLAAVTEHVRAGDVVVNQVVPACLQTGVIRVAGILGVVILLQPHLVVEEDTDFGHGNPVAAAVLHLDGEVVHRVGIVVEVSTVKVEVYAEEIPVGTAIGIILYRERVNVGGIVNLVLNRSPFAVDKTLGLLILVYRLHLQGVHLVVDVLDTAGILEVLLGELQNLVVRLVAGGLVIATHKHVHVGVEQTVSVVLKGVVGTLVELVVLLLTLVDDSGTVPVAVNLEVGNLGVSVIVAYRQLQLGLDGREFLVAVEAIFCQAEAGHVLVDVHAVLCGSRLDTEPHAVGVLGLDTGQILLGEGRHGDEVGEVGAGVGRLVSGTLGHIDAEVTNVVGRVGRGVQQEHFIVVGKGYTAGGVGLGLTHNLGVLLGVVVVVVVTD